MHECRDAGACYLCHEKSIFEALFLLKDPALLSGEGKPHVQCDQVLFLLICGRLSGYEQG